VDLNPVDIGSIIGFALSQNIYFDALVNQGYFGIDDWLERRMFMDEEEVIFDSKFDPFDGDIEKVLIERQLLSESTFSFTMTFSNYKED